MYCIATTLEPAVVSGQLLVVGVHIGFIFPTSLLILLIIFRFAYCSCLCRRM